MKTDTVTKHSTREQWLLAATEALKPLFRGCGFEIPPVKVSVSWPCRGALSATRRHIGECTAKTMADDSVCQIMISPLLGETVGKDGQGVLPTLAHELLHAVLGNDVGHGPKFAQACQKLGLDGKPTCTFAGEMLAERLEQLAAELGPFAHAKLNPATKIRKKDTARMIKCECGECGYTARTTRKWLDDAGSPICPTHNLAMLTDVSPGEGSSDEDED